MGKLGIIWSEIPRPLIDLNYWKFHAEEKPSSCHRLTLCYTPLTPLPEIRAVRAPAKFSKSGLAFKLNVSPVCVCANPTRAIWGSLLSLSPSLSVIEPSAEANAGWLKKQRHIKVRTVRCWLLPLPVHTSPSASDVHSCGVGENGRLRNGREMRERGKKLTLNLCDPHTHDRRMHSTAVNQSGTDCVCPVPLPLERNISLYFKIKL